VAAQRPTTAPRVALAALSAASAIGLVRVFAGAGWIVPAVLAALLPHALFAWTDRRRWPPLVSLFGVLAAGVLFTMVVVEPTTTFGGFPTRATFQAFGHDMGLASHVLRTAVVPVQPTGPALALALVSIWLVATAADWLAWRLDATLGALGPSLVLFVAVAALGEGPHWPTTLLYAAAAGAFLLAEHYAELLERRTWFHLTRRRRSRLLTGGAVAGVVAAVFALVLGPLLPGARGDAWFNYRGLGDHHGSGTWHTVTPLVDIKTRLVDPGNDELFTVKASHGQYWRMVALDQFDGQFWGLESEAPRVEGSQLPQGDAETPDALALTQQFTIETLNSRWLPAAFRAAEIEGVDNKLFISDSASLVSGNDTANNSKYTVQSLVPTPTRQELLAARPAPPEQWPRDLALPGDFPPEVLRLARRVVAGAHGPYEQAIALQSFFRDGDRFRYNTHVDAGHSDSAIKRFLFETRQGYCEQFAGTYAAMARAVGLPARVAVGFTPGRLDNSGVYHVTNEDAHAWPEVWLQGVGWMPFEPTPGRFEPTEGDPTTTGRDAPDRQQSATTSTTTGGTTTTAAGAPNAKLDPNKLGGAFIHAENGGGGSSGTHDDPLPRVLLGVGATAALAVLATIATLFTVLAVKWRRRIQRRHAANERDRVTGAWAEALDRLREAGVSPRASATPVEFAMRHAAAHGAGAAGPPLMDLARLQTAALFAPDAPSHEEADDAWVHVHRIEQALRRATRWSRRWKRRLDPRSLQLEPRTGAPA
jgi:transglutaminase-like putative cysteine protease